MKFRRLGAAAVVMGLLAGSVGGTIAQDEDGPTDYESWRTKEVEPGVLRILEDGAGRDLAQKWPRNHRGLDLIAIGPDGDVWVGVNVVRKDGKRSNESRLWHLGEERTYGPADGLGRHHYQLAFDEQGRLWLFGNRIATLDDGEWSSTRPSSAVVAPDGSVWVGGGLGVEQWDGTEFVTHMDGVWTGNVFLGPEGTVGVESWDGVRLFDGADWQQVSHRRPQRAVTEDGVLAMRDDGGKGLRLYGHDQETALLEDARINSMSAAPDGSLWIAGSVGRNRAAVYRVDPSAVFAAREAAEGAGSAEDATST